MARRHISSAGTADATHGLGAAFDASSAIALAFGLALAAAVSLGVTRFAYGLLLPPMRTDLNWTYTLAGAMNTANALGYLCGALATPWLVRQLGPGRLLIWGTILAGVFMGASGFSVDVAPLMLQRLLAGVASASVFIAGGLLAARLAARVPTHGGLLLGIYYGGVGFGITVSALLVPLLLHVARAVPHGWSWSWRALAVVCFIAGVALRWPVRALQRHEAVGVASAPGVEAVFRWRPFVPALIGYGLFGVGYIGYMTFVIALLKDQGVAPAAITGFFALLGVAVMASSRIWAGLLDRAPGGRAMTLLNALLGVATVVPALTASWPWLLASGMLFGAVFLSLVASTTALVRRNLNAVAWTTAMSVFTIVFASGQIVGPTIVGWISDGPGGLQRGLLFSAVALWVGALAALWQRDLAA